MGSGLRQSAAAVTNGGAASQHHQQLHLANAKATSQLCKTRTAINKPCLCTHHAPSRSWLHFATQSVAAAAPTREMGGEMKRSFSLPTGKL